MNKSLFTLFFLSLTAYAQQQERVAIINTIDDLDSIRVSELIFLTDRLRETSANVLPKSRYLVMTTESIVDFLGSQENAMKICNEASCLAELGRKVSADYVAQARIGRFGENLTIKTELYNSKRGNLIGSFTGSSKDIYGLLTIIDEKAEALFKKLPDTSGYLRTSVATYSVQGDIEGGSTSAKHKNEKKFEPRKVSLLPVSFLSGKADLTQEAKDSLVEIATSLEKLLTKSTAVIVCHTDNVGKRETKQKLSEDRAKSVMNFLINHSIDASRLSYEGKGPDQPIASNNTAAGRAKNRRCEIYNR